MMRISVRRTYVTPKMKRLALISESVLVGHSKDLHYNGSGGTEGGIGDGEFDGTFGVKANVNLWDNEW